MTILLIATFFLVEFIGMYFASQNTLNGLTELHQSIQSINQIRQLRQLLDTQQQLLNKSVKTQLTDDEIIILKNAEEQIDHFFEVNLELIKDTPDVYALIEGAQRTLKPLRDHSFKIINRDPEIPNLSPIVLDQYILEAQDLLGKVQIVQADDSDHIFHRIYDSRFTPLIVGSGLSMVFLVFVLWFGISLRNRIDRPIQNLVDATLALANGNLKVRAHVNHADEIGALGHAFNSMADKLEESVTERKNVALDLIEAKEAAESANMAKSAFLANMSHEIRTPLGAVLGFSELIVDPGISASEKGNFISAIKRNGELLSNIINDILDLSKIEAGKMQIVTQDVALSEILSDTKMLLGLQAKEKGIELNVDIDPTTPEKIKTDPLRLRQILINIIGNALKFTAKGSVNVKIGTVTNIEGKTLLGFVVKDTGAGIKPEQAKKLFTPFSQADATTKRKFGGTGLGLVLSKRFAKLLGGDVLLTESQINQGSTFTITIDPGPVQIMHTEEVKTKFVEAQKGALHLEHVCVLLAEDSPDNQIIVTRILKLAGAEVQTASNGQEALSKALADKFDVILMDLQMPVMDGYEATAHLRNSGYQGKIIALTAHALNEERERCLRSGFDDHLSKPINRELLIERVYYFSRESLGEKKV